MVKVPTTRTLRKYGLTADDFVAMAVTQGNACGLCFKLPDSKILVIDHEHVKGWKRMSPVERKQHVRGLLCSHCNHRYVNKYLSVEVMKLAIVYLTKHSNRKSANVSTSNQDATSSKVSVAKTRR